jgi:hypothetical protein
MQAVVFEFVEDRLEAVVVFHEGGLGDLQVDVLFAQAVVGQVVGDITEGRWGLRSCLAERLMLTKRSFSDLF